MVKAVYLFAVCLLSKIRSGTFTSFETVWVKDVTTRFQTDKRTIIDLDLPNDLTFHLTRESEILTLNLKRNHDINPHADVYFARQLKGGRPVLVKSRNYEKEDVAYYQDMENWAYMTVRCVNKLNEPCDRIINGNLRIGDRSYNVQPVETDVTSKNLVEDTRGLGKPYVLKDQTHVQRGRGHSVQKKGITPVKENNEEHNIESFLQHFRGQHKHKRNNLSRIDDTLYSPNTETVLNITETDKSRQLKKFYHVKMAVLIDSSTWNFYLSTVSRFTLLTRSRNTKRKIQQMYSHLFNGVHLLYKGIVDPEISINIILAKFVYFKELNDFPHKRSIVVSYNTTKYIDAVKYLQDIERWDVIIGSNIEPAYDHGMLFTMYRMYRDYLNVSIKNDYQLNGLSSRERVCDTAKKTSVVRPEDFSRTVSIVAHELGHSLGAFHDGEGSAIDCRNEDGFIMSTYQDHDDPEKPYSRNPWLFSRCSVRSFKQILRGKSCVTSHGRYYNQDEYIQHVKKQAGEIFTANQQCALILGEGSVVCETPVGNICRFMKCTNSKTGVCENHYYRAARGTECGSSMWCIEGRCVSRS